MSGLLNNLDTYKDVHRAITAQGRKPKKEYYWLAVNGKTIPQWKKPFTPKGKSAVFKMMRKKKKEMPPATKFSIHSSKRGVAIWESWGPEFIFELKF